MANEGNQKRFQAELSWRPRVFALLRFVCFAAIFVVTNLGVHSALSPIHRQIKSFEGHALLEMSVLGSVTVTLACLMTKISGRRFGAYGLGGSHKVRFFATGLATGALLLAAQLALEESLHVLSFGQIVIDSRATFPSALLIGAWCLATSFTEENLFRGFALVEFSRAVSFWPAVILMSVLFGFLHWRAEGENIMGGLGAFLLGIGFSWSFRATGSLWFAIGFHAAWNFVQSFVFGVADSGLVSAGRLLHPVTHGPAWLSGGSVGPEGSALILVPFAAFVGIVWLYGRPSASAIETT